MRTDMKAFLFALCLGASLAVSQTAIAKEPELYFYPARGWTVKPAPFTEVSTGAPICILMSQYNNGFLIQMSGSAQGPDNINIDFRQPAFEEGSVQNVTLGVPGAASKNLPAKAQDKNLLVIDLKQNKELFSAMRTAGVFDMEVGANAFRFYLTGIGEAGKRFDTCTASGKAPAVAPAPATQEAGITTEKSDAKQGTEISALEKKMEAKSTETGSIAPPPPQPDWLTKPSITSQETTPARQADLSVPPQNSTQAPGYKGKRLSEQLLEEMQRHPVEEKPAMAAPTQQPAPGVIDLTKAETQMKKAAPVETAKQDTAAKPAFTKTSTDIGEINWKQEKAPVAKDITKEALEAKSSPMKPTTTPVVKQAMTAPQLEKPTSPSVTETSRTSVRTPAPATTHKKAEGEFDFTSYGKVEPASADERPGRASAISQSERDAGLNEKIAELERMVQQLKTENAALDTELKSSLTESAVEHTTISSENWNLERATMRFNEAERQLQRMGQELQQQRAQCSAEKQQLEAMLFDPEVTSQQQLARLSTLEQQAAQSKSELETQRQRYEERIRMLESQLRTQ